MLVCHLSKVCHFFILRIYNHLCDQDQEDFSPLSHLVLDLLELDTAQVTPVCCLQGHMPSFVQVQRGSVELDDTVRYLDLLQVDIRCCQWSLTNNM